MSRTALTFSLASSAALVLTLAAVPAGAAQASSAPSVRVVENHGVADDGRVATGTRIRLEFTGLPTPPPGGWDLTLTSRSGTEVVASGVVPEPAGDGTYRYTYLGPVLDFFTDRDTWTYSLGAVATAQVHTEGESVRLQVEDPRGEPSRLAAGDRYRLKAFGLDPDARFVVVAETLLGDVRTVSPVRRGYELGQDLYTAEAGDLSHTLYLLAPGATGFGGTDEQKIAWLNDRNNVLDHTSFDAVRTVQDAPGRGFAAIGGKAGDASRPVTLTWENLQKGDVTATSPVMAVSYDGRDLYLCRPDEVAVRAEPGGTLGAGCAVDVSPGRLIFMDLRHAPANWREYPTGRDLAAAVPSAQNVYGPMTWFSIGVNVQEHDAWARTPRQYAIDEASEATPPEGPVDDPGQDPGPSALIPAQVRDEDIVLGDWDGDGTQTPGWRVGNLLFLADGWQPGAQVQVFVFGRLGDEILVGDWDGDGKDTFAVRRGATVYYKNSLAGGSADGILHYGRAGDAGVVGDWDGDGVDGIGVRRENRMLLKDDFAGGWADHDLTYGRAADQVFVGDWDGDGVDTPAVLRGGALLVTNVVTTGVAESVLPAPAGSGALLVRRGPEGDELVRAASLRD